MFRLSILAIALSVPVMLCGCVDNSGDYQELTEADDVENTHDDHHHHDHAAGPHGGHILEFGKYHGEITVSNETVSVYVLGDDAKTSVPVAGTAVLHLKSGDKTIEVPLEAAPEEGEPEGESSRYQAGLDKLPEGIDDIEKIAGSVELKVGEETFTAEVSHDHGHAHDHHDH